MKVALLLALLLGSGAVAQAQVSVGIGLPGVSIGVNVPVYPRLERVPGHAVYWAPSGAPNYFFVDGLYWVFRNDAWYHSGWYNGPWQGAEPYDVPVALLRVPVSYYRQPPAYFRPWRATAAPRWGEHWGPAWEQRRPGWDHMDRRQAQRVLPPPVYQREYRGDRYPHAREQQDEIRRNREPGTRNPPGRDSGHDGRRDDRRGDNKDEPRRGERH